MAPYGIRVVPAEWQPSMPLPFTQAMHDTKTLEQGTRILLYREGIIGEGEVHAFAIRPSEWPAQTTADLPAALKQADYLQPISLLYTREEPLAPDEVRKALGDESFPQGDVWLPIAREVYEKLANWPY